MRHIKTYSTHPQKAVEAVVILVILDKFITALRTFLGSKETGSTTTTTNPGE